MSNKNLINYMEKLGGSNSNVIKIANLENMLDSEVIESSESSNTSAYTNSILDLFLGSDSSSTYDSEGGKGKTKPKGKKSKKNKKKNNKKKKTPNSDSDSDSLLEHIKTSEPHSQKPQPYSQPQLQSQPPRTGLSNLALLSSTNSLVNPSQNFQPSKFTDSASLYQQPNTMSLNLQPGQYNSVPSSLQQMPSSMQVPPSSATSQPLGSLVNLAGLAGLASLLQHNVVQSQPVQPIQVTLPSQPAQTVQTFQPAQTVQTFQPPQTFQTFQPPQTVQTLQIQPAQQGVPTQTIQVTPEQMKILEPLLSQIATNPNIKLSDIKLTGNNPNANPNGNPNANAELDKVDNDIDEIEKRT